MTRIVSAAPKSAPFRETSRAGGSRSRIAAAWAAVRLENDYQAERWGLDAEAEAHAAGLRGEFEIAAQFLDLHRAG